VQSAILAFCTQFCRAVGDSYHGRFAGWLDLTVLYTCWQCGDIFHTGRRWKDIFRTGRRGLEISTPAGARTLFCHVSIRK
jgi:hypothetical protein